MRCLVVFFFNDTATTEIYTLSLHDALPIYDHPGAGDGELRPGDQRREVRTAQVERGLDAVHAHGQPARLGHGDGGRLVELPADRKSTRLNSSHANISYAVFCL